MRDAEKPRNFHSNPWPARLRTIALGVVFLLWLPAVRAQDQDAEEQPLEGTNSGNYNIKQSIEFGGRIDSISGSQSVYDTFVNLQQGPRLLGFTTEMRSLDNHGSLFDRLYLNSYGYGGDPNDASRLRVSKNKWYDFDVLLRPPLLEVGDTSGASGGDLQIGLDRALRRELTKVFTSEVRFGQRGQSDPSRRVDLEVRADERVGWSLGQRRGRDGRAFGRAPRVMIE